MTKIEIVSEGDRRWCWPAAEKLRIVEKTLYESKSISAVARRNGVAPKPRVKNPINLHRQFGRFPF